MNEIEEIMRQFQPQLPARRPLTPEVIGRPPMPQGARPALPNNSFIETQGRTLPPAATGAGMGMGALGLLGAGLLYPSQIGQEDFSGGMYQPQTGDIELMLGQMGAPQGGDMIEEIVSEMPIKAGGTYAGAGGGALPSSDMGTANLPMRKGQASNSAKSAGMQNAVYQPEYEDIVYEVYGESDPEAAADTAATVDFAERKKKGAQMQIKKGGVKKKEYEHGGRFKAKRAK
jgi:hypothetical protein